MLQKEDKKFAQLLNCLCIEEHTAADISLLQTCVISQDQSLVMSDVPHFSQHKIVQQHTMKMF